MEILNLLKSWIEEVEKSKKEEVSPDGIKESSGYKG